MAKRLLTALVGAVVAVVLMAGPALAEGLVIRKVDTASYPEVKVSVLVNGESPSLTDFKLRENGQLVSGLRVVPLGQTDTRVGVVLAIDISGSMRAKGKLAQAQAAAKQFIGAKKANEEIAIVAFNDQARVASNFTTDAGLLEGVIDGLTASGETALYDAVSVGAGLLSQRPELVANLVVLSDGKDTVSVASAAQAQSSVVSSKAVAYTLALRGSEFDPSFLLGLSQATSGEYVETADPTALAGLFAKVRSSIQNQYELTYTSAPGQAQAGSIDLVVSTASAQASAGVAVGGVAQGKNVAPEEVKGSSLPGALTNSNSWVIAVVLVLLAAALLAYGLILVFVRDRSALQTALQSYEPYSPSPVASAADDDDDGHSMVETAFLRRAVETTGRLADERGLLDRVEQKLDQADLPLRPAEVIFFSLAMVVIFTLIGLVLGSFLGGLVALIVFGLGPIAVLNFLSSRRQRKFTSQLPDTLQLLSGSLRAGYSLLQGVDAVAQQVENPMGKELGRALSEARLGRSVDDALGDVALRMGSPDFEWAVMAIRIQREVGGNLAELLITVAETMIARERLRRDVKALTAEGRISAIVLGIMPVALGVMLFVINPDYMSKLFDTGVGQVMLGGSILLALFGFYWMKKTIEIEI